MDQPYSKQKLIDQSSDFLTKIDLGKKHIEELIRANVRYKTRIEYLEQLVGSSDDQVDQRVEVIQEKIMDLEEQLINLNERYERVQRENVNFAEQFIRVEEQNNNLANLYIASYQLHSTLDFNETLQIVMEIVMNLVGAEEFALYLVDTDEQMLLRAASEGNNVAMKEEIAFGEGIIGTVLETKQGFYARDIIQQRLTHEPLAVIPLKIKNEVIAVISIYKLFAQKTGFSMIDHNLFDLLAGHAATAIFGSQLYTRSVRKKTTLKTFLDLIKSS